MGETALWVKKLACWVKMSACWVDRERRNMDTWRDRWKCGERLSWSCDLPQITWPPPEGVRIKHLGAITKTDMNSNQCIMSKYSTCVMHLYSELQAHSSMEQWKFCYNLSWLLNMKTTSVHQLIIVFFHTVKGNPTLKPNSATTATSILIVNS